LIALELYEGKYRLDLCPKREGIGGAILRARGQRSGEELVELRHEIAPRGELGCDAVKVMRDAGWTAREHA